MHASITAFTIALCAGQVLGRSIKRQSPTVTVTTESEGLQWARSFPDQLAPVTEYFYEPTVVTATCYIYTTMDDDKGKVNDNPLYIKLDRSAQGTYDAYISEEQLAAGDIDFESELNECPEVYHATTYVDSKYWYEINDPSRDNLTYYAHKCYSAPNFKSASIDYFDVGYESIKCFKEGGENVNGNTTWTLSRDDKSCYVPAGWNTANEYHGVAPVC